MGVQNFLAHWVVEQGKPGTTQHRLSAAVEPRRGCVIPQLVQGCAFLKVCASAIRSRSCGRWLRFVATLVAVAFLAEGCRTAGPAPKLNLQAPGWTLHQGQAVWRLEHGSREIAGEVLVATGRDGRAFVQFTKAPFPIVTAQLAPHEWWAEFPPQGKRYSGHGNPPERIIFLQLARILAGNPPLKNWSWQSDPSGWKLTNEKSGESLEGFFNQ